MHMLCLTDNRIKFHFVKLNEDHSDNKYKSRLQANKHEEYSKV